MEKNLDDGDNLDNDDDNFEKELLIKYSSSMCLSLLFSPL